ncbi:hypothetical protein J6590_049328 [Homalodisca vitripennis]|nr:hypothetical protein J6590_049328 [Homalodisca vitripennis]
MKVVLRKENILIGRFQLTFGSRISPPVEFSFRGALQFHVDVSGINKTVLKHTRRLARSLGPAVTLD